ncbi:MAG: hypothetical protein ACI4QI_04090 [Candidatus Coproplasma sp.]
MDNSKEIKEKVMTMLEKQYDSLFSKELSDDQLDGVAGGTYLGNGEYSDDDLLSENGLKFMLDCMRKSGFSQEVLDNMTEQWRQARIDCAQMIEDIRASRLTPEQAAEEKRREWERVCKEFADVFK